MRLSKQSYTSDYSKGTVFLLEYPATEFREHFVNNATYSNNSKINAAAQIATINMLRRTVQGIKIGDTRPIRLYTVVCDPLSVANASNAAYKQYEFATKVSGAIVGALAFLIKKRLPKKLQDNKHVGTGLSLGVSAAIGARIQKYMINNIRKFSAGDVDIMTFIEVNGGIGPQYSFSSTHLTIEDY
jgi:hypothetical protein